MKIEFKMFENLRKNKEIKTIKCTHVGMSSSRKVDLLVALVFGMGLSMVVAGVISDILDSHQGKELGT